MSIIYPAGGNPAAVIGYLRALAADLEAMSMFAPREELEGAPLLENWSFIVRPVTALRGEAVGHPLLGDRHVATSELFALDEEAGWARTLSRFYRLGTAADIKETI